MEKLLDNNNKMLKKHELTIRRTGFGVLLLLLFISSTDGVFAISEESKSFNDLGMGMYDQYDYIAAGESFIRAIETDPENFLAHYNLACAMSLLRKDYVPRDFRNKRFASFNIDADTILRYLERSVELDEHRITRMLEDPDLLSLHSSLRFHQIAGRSLTTPADANIILPAVSWRLDSGLDLSGETGLPEGMIAFDENGYFHLQLQNDGFIVSGRYSVQGRTLMCMVMSGKTMLNEVMGILSENGAVFTGLGESPLVMWNDTEE